MQLSTAQWTEFLDVIGNAMKENNTTELDLRYTRKNGVSATFSIKLTELKDVGGKVLFSDDD